MFPRVSAHLRSDEPNADELPGDVEIRAATVDDAAGVWTLVHESEALDVNSPYAYLLAFRHHTNTSVVAVDGERVVGFVLAYCPPSQPDVVFVWQIGVAASHRRLGLGGRLLHAVVDRETSTDVRYLEATVTPSNDASLRMFQRFAEGLEAPFDVTPCFAADQFPSGEAHEPENLVRIGPFPPRHELSATEHPASESPEEEHS